MLVTFGMNPVPNQYSKISRKISALVFLRCDNINFGDRRPVGHIKKYKTTHKHFVGTLKKILWLLRTASVSSNNRVKVHHNFRVSSEQFQLYRDESSVTRTISQTFRGYEYSFERRERSAIYTNDTLRCDYRIGDSKNYYPSNSLYPETNVAVI